MKKEIEKKEDLNKIYNELKDKNIKNIICYGLGHLGSCKVSQAQTSLLLILKDFLNVSVEIYDPLFNYTDLKLCLNFDFKVISHNELGKRSVNETTLFYMPHCGTPLYNNLLWANWNPENLVNCIIIGNCLDHLLVNRSSKLIDKYFKFMKLALPLCSQVFFDKLKVFDDYNVFSSQSLIMFNVENAGKSIWEYNVEPNYENLDAEIITDEIKNNLLIE